MKNSGYIIWEVATSKGFISHFSKMLITSPHRWGAEKISTKLKTRCCIICLWFSDSVVLNITAIVSIPQNSENHKCVRWNSPSKKIPDVHKPCSHGLSQSPPNTESVLVKRNNPTLSGFHSQGNRNLLFHDGQIWSSFWSRNCPNNGVGECQCQMRAR
jgi:hypothetical protein